MKERNNKGSFRKRISVLIGIVVVLIILSTTIVSATSAECSPNGKHWTVNVGDIIGITTGASEGSATFTMRENIFFGQEHVFDRINIGQGEGQNHNLDISTANMPNGTDTITIVATDDSTGDVLGSCSFTLILVATPVNLKISMSESPDPVVSKGSSQVTVHVTTTGGLSVSGASVSVTAKDGTLSPKSGTTDVNGDFKTAYTAPSIDALSFVDKISATVSKSGFGVDSVEDSITVKPLLVISISESPDIVVSEVSSQVTIHVTTRYGHSVSGASVSLSTTGGRLTPKTGTSDANGDFKTTYTAPTVTTPTTYTISAVASKSGFMDGTGNEQVTIKLNIPSHMEFVQIPAGEFDMGSPSTDVKGYDGERPVHHVKFANAFYLGKYEVTQKQWQEVMGTNPSHSIGDDLPVNQVSWDDVQQFIKTLNKKEGTTKYRLPSEAEWEYAARAGTTTRYSFGDDESKLGDYAWYYNNSGSETHEFHRVHDVGLKKPNAWGLYDMHGNVREWVQDTWYNDYNGAPTDGSSWVSGSSIAKVLRAAVWSITPLAVLQHFAFGAITPTPANAITTLAFV